MSKGMGIAVFVVAAAAHLFIIRGAIHDFSPTYDEPVHLTAGFAALRAGEYRYNGHHHPPFGEMWAALPLLSLNPILPTQHPAWLAQRWSPADQYQFADVFLYKNRISADRLIEAGRWMQALLSVILGAAVMIVATSTAGVVAGVVAAFLWAVSPTFLANGAIVSTDLAFSVFYFCFFAALRPPFSYARSALAGLFLGLAFASKYFALAALPTVALLLVVDRSFRRPVIAWAIVAATATITLAVVYRGSNLDVFWEGLTALFGRSQAGRSSFLLGQHGTSGWLLYFPFVFLVKTPISLLVALAIVVVLAPRRKLAMPMWLWIPPLVFFGIACASKVQIGHRHILAVYPFLFVTAGFMAAMGGVVVRWLVPPVLLLAAVEAITVRPNFLSFFNRLAGGGENGYRQLTDSNVDWGQGLKLLAGHLTDEEKRNGIYLCYFGVADPHAYGIRYKDAGSDRLVSRVDDSGAMPSAPTTLAISVTNLQATYYADKTVFDWVKAYTPRAKVADSIFVYDFSQQPDALAHLRRIAP